MPKELPLPPFRGELFLVGIPFYRTRNFKRKPGAPGIASRHDAAQNRPSDDQDHKSVKSLPSTQRMI